MPVSPCANVEMKDTHYSEYEDHNKWEDVRFAVILGADQSMLSKAGVVRRNMFIMHGSGAKHVAMWVINNFFSFRAL